MAGKEMIALQLGHRHGIAAKGSEALLWLIQPQGSLKDGWGMGEPRSNAALGTGWPVEEL